jgi:hypothetical protein
MTDAVAAGQRDMTPDAITVVPAKAGTQRLSLQRHWIPASAGMTALQTHWIPGYAGMTALQRHWIPACAGMTALRKAA